MSDQNAQLAKLRSIVHGLGSCLVAFSGGVDSAVVLAVAHEQLPGRALACIGVSPSVPARERAAAIEFARSIDADYRLIEPAEHLRPDYARNANDRCYFCKAALFDRLRALAAEEGWNTIIDGTHLDDVGDHEHGMRAAAERAIRSPLLEARLDKRSVRALANTLNLRVWDKPAMACLASRVPHGTPVTPALLHQIERAEDVLAAHGFRQFRVRHHGELARMLELRLALVAEIRAAGYRFVTLDLAAFRGTNESPDLVQVRVRHHVESRPRQGISLP
jgi:uncharacterized protein